MSVEFHDYSIQVKQAIHDKSVAYLHEAAGEVEAQTKRNIPSGGQFYVEQKQEWTNVVDESKLEATIGNPMQQALWTEFGTGEYAIHGDGRKGYWVYVKGSDGSLSTKGGKQYNLNEAKQAVAYLRSKGLDASYTKGQPAKRPFENAFNALKSALIRRAENMMGDLNR